MQKADVLALKMREVLAEKDGIRITRPVQTAEIRIKDLDDSVQVKDLEAAIASAGGCSPADIKVGEIRRSGGRGLGTAWARCPVAANKIVAARKIRVGWINARVEALERRVLQYFRCLERGHVQATCGSGPDRGAAAGESGHLVRDWARPVKCPICARTAIRPPNGLQRCNPPKRKNRSGATTSPPASTACTQRMEVEEEVAGPSNAREEAVAPPLP